MIINTNRTFLSSKWRRIFGSLFLTAAAMAALAAINSSRATNPGGSPNEEVAATKIAPWVVEHTANGEQAELMVVLADQADLSWAAAMRTKNEKGRYVRDMLGNT